MMYCPYCGKENADQAKYCAGCGKQLPSGTKPAPEDVPEKQGPPDGPDHGGRKKRWKWLLVILILAAIVVVVLLLAVPGVTSRSDEPETGVREGGDNMLIMDAGFTDRLITEEESAVLAAQDVSDAMGYENAFDDLTPYLTTTADGGSYYRLQEFYQGIPVYQRYVTVVASEEGEALGLYTDAVDIDEDLSLTPTLTDEEARAAVVSYAQSRGEEISDDMALFELSDDALVIYIPDGSEPACLAYELTVENNSFYRVILDAQTGEILELVSTIDSVLEEGTNPEGTLTFPVDFDEDSGTYTMGDPERNLFIYNLNGALANDEDNHVAEKNLKDASAVVSAENNIFGDTDEEVENDVDIAANLMTNVCGIIDWYDGLGQEVFLGQKVPYGRVDVYYNSTFASSGGANAVGGSHHPSNSKDVGFLALGSDLDGTELDAITHEFTHIVARVHDVATGVCDNGISEGLADTFACFYTGDWDIDLTMVGLEHRSAEDPAAYGYPTTMTDQNKSKESDEHAYATVISHAAYLMYDSGAFTMDELTGLWYQTLLVLPSNCSYLNLAYGMQGIAGNSEDYTDDQLVAVICAFAEVGIYSYLSANNVIELHVYDCLGDYYDDYTIEISGKQVKQGFFGNSEAEYTDEISVDTAEPYVLELPNGEYEIKVKDNAGYGGNVEETDGKSEQIFYVIASNYYDEASLSCYNLGAQYIAAPGAEIVVKDRDGSEVDFTDAIARTYELDAEGALQLDDGGNYIADDTSVAEGILDVPEYNYYDLWIRLPDDPAVLSDEDDAAADRVCVSVRVREGGADTVTVILPFAYASKVVEEEEAAQETVFVTDDMYPELLTGGLTREQFEVALAYAPEEIEDGTLTANDLLTMVGEICYDFADLCFEGYIDESKQDFWHYISQLDTVNRFLSVLTDYALSESDMAGWNSSYGLTISGNTVDVTLYDGEWMTPLAEITSAVLSDDTLTVTYDVRGRGPGGYYPEGTGTRTAVLVQTESGRYRVNRIFQGTPQTPYHVTRQDLLTVDEGDWVSERIYYDLVSLNETSEANQAINAGLEADYQAFLAYTERVTGKAASDLSASDPVAFHYVSAGVSNVENGIFSLRFLQTVMAGEDASRQYGLTYSLETGEELGIRDLTDLSDEELLSRIKLAIRTFLSDSFSQVTSEQGAKIDAYTLDDIGSGMGFWDSGKLSFCVQAGEIYILTPPNEYFDSIWSDYAIPTGIYISGVEVSATEVAEVSADTFDGDYILPDSDSKYLSRSDLVGLSREELRIARNEIYARHGRKFDDSGLKEYFNSKSWYQGTVDPDDFDNGVLNDYEIANRDLIVAYEAELEN